MERDMNAGRSPLRPLSAGDSLPSPASRVAELKVRSAVFWRAVHDSWGKIITDAWMLARRQSTSWEAYWATQNFKQRSGQARGWKLSSRRANFNVCALLTDGINPARAGFPREASFYEGVVCALMQLDWLEEELRMAHAQLAIRQSRAHEVRVSHRRRACPAPFRATPRAR